MLHLPGPALSLGDSFMECLPLESLSKLLRVPPCLACNQTLLSAPRILTPRNGNPSRNNSLVLAGNGRHSFLGARFRTEGRHNEDGFLNCSMSRSRPRMKLGLNRGANSAKCATITTNYHRAIVVEDAVSGVQAGFKGNFGLVIGVARENNVHE